MFLLLASATLYHCLLRELSIGLPTQWAGQALVPLLVTAVTHRVVQVPARTRTAPRSSGSTIATHSAILKNQNIIHIHVLLVKLFNKIHLFMVCIWNTQQKKTHTALHAVQLFKYISIKYTCSFYFSCFLKPLQNTKSKLNWKWNTIKSLYDPITLHFQPFFGMAVMTGFRQKVW